MPVALGQVFPPVQVGQEVFYLKKKIKKIFLILPFIFTFVLSFIPIGTVSAANIDSTYYYTDEYFQQYDFGQDFLDYILKDCSSKTNNTDYFYEVYLGNNSYSNYLKGSGDCSIIFQIFYFNPGYEFDFPSFPELFCINDPKIFTYYKYSLTIDLSDKQILDPSSLITSGNTISQYFYYNKSNGLKNFSLSEIETPILPEYHILYQSTNIEDFPLVPFEGSSDALNVDVQFTPDLSGDVNRKSVDSNNNISYSSGFKMKVTNNCKFPIQYRFSIRDKAESDKHDETMGPLAGTNLDYYGKFRPFVYYSNEWVHAHSLESEELHDNFSQTVNKASAWHYLSAGESVEVSFKYSQINLIENYYYYAEVYALRVDGDYASEMYSVLPDSMENQMDVRSLVYFSTFRMLQYSDVKYDPSDSSNGVLPFNGSDYYDKYRYSYNAALDEEGNVDYTGKDLYNDPDSWYNKPTGVDSIKYNGGNPHLIQSSSFSTLSRSFSGFLGFVNSVLNYFPPSFLILFSVGLTSIVVLALIKAVFR